MRRIALTIALLTLPLGSMPAAFAQVEGPAIAKGVDYLRRSARGFDSGVAGIAALALIKAEVPESDPGLKVLLNKAHERFSGSIYSPGRTGGPDIYVEASVIGLAFRELRLEGRTRARWPASPASWPPGRWGTGPGTTQGGRSATARSRNTRSSGSGRPRTRAWPSRRRSGTTRARWVPRQSEPLGRLEVSPGRAGVGRHGLDDRRRDRLAPDLQAPSSQAIGPPAAGPTESFSCLVPLVDGGRPSS